MDDDINTPPPAPPSSPSSDDHEDEESVLPPNGKDEVDFIDSLLASEEQTFKKCFNKEFVYEDSYNSKPSSVTCSNSDFSFGGKTVTFCPDTSSELRTEVTAFLQSLQESSNP
jgi:hypothetical protein